MSAPILYLGVPVDIAIHKPAAFVLEDAATLLARHGYITRGGWRGPHGEMSWPIAFGEAGYDGSIYHFRRVMRAFNEADERAGGRMTAADCTTAEIVAILRVARDYLPELGEPDRSTEAWPRA